MPQVRRVLISVTDKTGIADFARGLNALGAEIISTGGTARVLRAAGISAWRFIAPAALAAFAIGIVVDPVGLTAPGALAAWVRRSVSYVRTLPPK